MRKLVFIVLILSSLAFAKIWRRATGGGVTSNCAGIASGSFTITTPLVRQIVQRNASNIGSIPVSGTTSATYAQARVIPVSGYPGTQTQWQQVPIVAGSVSGSINANSGWYSLEVQTCTNGLLVADTTLSRVGVGDVFITSGQSNATNYYQPFAATPPDDRVNSRGITSMLPWRLATDPQDTADNTFNSVWPTLGNLIVAHTGFPVGFISVGVGNTTVHDWIPAGSNYPRINSALGYFPVNGFRSFLWHQGENDAAASTSQASYFNDLKSIIDQIRTDAGWQVPCGIGDTVTWPNGATGAGTMAGQAQAAAYTGCFAGANSDTLDNTYRQNDHVHFNTTSGMAAHAGLWYTAIVTHFGI